jgi:cell division protein FtsN
VAPQYSEALSLAARGLSAEDIADQCDMSVGEAELVRTLGEESWHGRGRRGMSAQVARMRLGGKIEADDQDVQRTALLRRVAVAGAMIAMLIGGLALFDASRKPVEPPPRRFASIRRLRPLPNPSRRPRKPHCRRCRRPMKAAVEAAPVNLAGHAAAAAGEHGSSRSAAGSAEADAEPAPAAAAPVTPGRPVTGEGERRAPAATQRAPAQAAARAPAAQPITRTPPPAAVGQGEITGYRVQVGVFSSVANAEDVRAKLALKGIPSQIEARVHVGPFKSRAEADQARAKLRALGMDSGAPSPVRAAVGHP